MTSQNNTLRNITLSGIFTALIIVGAFIKIPIPNLPITLQTFFTALAGIILGRKWGALSVTVYVLLGLAGMPIFAKGGGGFGYILTPTFGFLIGFIAGCWLTGLLFERAKQKNALSVALSSMAGYGVIYAIGLPYFYLITNVYMGTPKSIGWVLYYCFLITLPGDIIKCAALSLLAPRIAPRIKRPS